MLHCIVCSKINIFSKIKERMKRKERKEKEKKRKEKWKDKKNKFVLVMYVALYCLFTK